LTILTSLEDSQPTYLADGGAVSVLMPTVVDTTSDHSCRNFPCVFI